MKPVPNLFARPRSWAHLTRAYSPFSSGRWMGRQQTEPDASGRSDLFFWKTELSIRWHGQNHHGRRILVVDGKSCSDCHSQKTVDFLVCCGSVIKGMVS